jgi:predicted Zn-dependent peptidase
VKRTSWRALALCLPLSATPQSLSEFEKRVSEFTLSNGLHFVVAERPEAPVVSFQIVVGAGSVDDPVGRGGLARMLERMFLKGTETVGTTNVAAEKKALDELEQALDRYTAERRRPSADPRALLKAEAQYKLALSGAKAFEAAGVYAGILEQNGATGLLAEASADFTTFSMSLPANRIELWFLLQSAWLRKPVFRGFYAERDAMERARAAETDVRARLRELLLTTAFTAHPYRSQSGWPGEIGALRASDAARFHSTYYTPANVTIGIAGAFRLAEVRRLAEKYFSAPPDLRPPEVAAIEPPQDGERRATLETAVHPELLMGYKRPDLRHADGPVFEAIEGLLAGGRTGLLHKELVYERRIATDAGVTAMYPGGRYPGLFVVQVRPALGHTVEECEDAVLEVIEGLQTGKPSEADLRRVSDNLRAALWRRLDDNAGLAGQLPFFHARYGNWKVMFTRLDQVAKVTPNDVQRVARQYFVPKSRTVVHTLPVRYADYPTPTAPTVSSAPSTVSPLAAPRNPLQRRRVRIR